MKNYLNKEGYMTKENAMRVIGKIRHLEKYLSNLEKNNYELTSGLKKIRKNLYLYLRQDD